MPSRTIVRTAAERKRDTLAMLESEVDLWLSSAGGAGRPHLVPVSFFWDGGAVVVATVATTLTARNLISGSRARLALGTPSDVVILDVTRPEVITIGTEIALEDAFAGATGFDPRLLDGEYVYLRLTPDVIQAWKGPAELTGRHVMRDGQWLV